MKLKAWVLGIAMAVAAPLAMAEGSGFYGAVDFGKATADGFCDDTAGLSCTDNDTSVRFTLGNQLNANFGVEGSYGPDVEATLSGFGLTYVAKNTEWQFAAIGTAPVGNGFSIFGKVGMAFWEIQESLTGFQSKSTSGNDFLVGIGAKIDINPTMAIRGQYETHKIGDDATTGRSDLNTLSMGLLFKF